MASNTPRPRHFADGALAEIFLTNRHTGSQSDANAKDSAVMASIALRFGASLETLRHAVLRDGHSNPSTPLGAALDYIAEQLS